MKWFRKIGYYAKEIRKEMRETGRATDSDFKSLQRFYSDKEKIKQATSKVDELIELYDDDEDKEKVVDLKEIKRLLLIPSIDEADAYVAAVDSARADTGRDSFNSDLEELLDFLRS